MNPVISALAFRNLTQNPRRTLLAVAALSIGLAALILLWSFNAGLHGNMTRNFQETIVGSLQVHRNGFFHRPDLELHIETPEAVVDAVVAQGIKRWSRRLEAFALATSDEASVGVVLIGMDPEREAVVTKLPHKVDAGRFFNPTDAYGCVLGAATARNLKLELGDALVFVGYNRFGELVAEEFELVGLITTGEMGIDRGLAVVPLAALQEMLDMDNRVTNIVLQIDPERLEQVTAGLRHALAASEYEVLRWNDMFPVMQEWIVLHNGFLYLFLVIIGLIVLAGVLNTLLLAMIRRTREFGILLALGHKRWEIAALVVLEAAFIGLAGILSGMLLGIALVTLLGYTGIDLSSFIGQSSHFYVDPVVHPRLQLEHLWLTASAILAATLAASLYPAWRTTRLEPVEAIRHG